MAIKINGKIKHIELEGGFWGIITSNENYAPVDLPEQLKANDKIVNCSIEILDIMTVQNWGIPCRMFSFTTFDSE